MANKFLRFMGFNTNPDHDALVIALLIMIVLLMIGTLVFYIAEDLNIFDALYFAMMSISTIGYGDIVPTTTASKIVVMVYSITGVPLFIYTASLFVEVRIKNIVGTYMEEQQEQLEDITDELEDIGEDLEKFEKRLKKTKQQKKKSDQPLRKRLIANNR